MSSSVAGDSPRTTWPSFQPRFTASWTPTFRPCPSLGRVDVRGVAREQHPTGAVGSRLTSGVDLWLNNPRRPLEASGTSGQKVVLNGGLNCSILDGWWAEAFDGENGFAIGAGEVHRDIRLQDERDADALRTVLREEIAPLFYERDAEDIPRGWLRRIKRSMATLSWRFSADRMVRDYLNGAYLPAAGAIPADHR